MNPDNVCVDVPSTTLWIQLCIMMATRPHQISNKQSRHYLCRRWCDSFQNPAQWIIIILYTIFYVLHLHTFVPDCLYKVFFLPSFVLADIVVVLSSSSVLLPSLWLTHRNAFQAPSHPYNNRVISMMCTRIPSSFVHRRLQQQQH